MKKWLILLAILVLLPIGLAEEEHITDVSCEDTSCQNDLQCISLPEKGRVCVTWEFANDPCKYYTCPAGTQCLVAETAPASVYCSPISSPEEDLCAGKSCGDLCSPSQSDMPTATVLYYCQLDGSCDHSVPDCEVKEKKPVEPSDEPTASTTKGPEIDAGVEPDSPFYALDRFMERLQLKFAGDEISRARLHLKFANERLAESYKMAYKNKEQERERAMEQYEGEMNDTDEEVDKAQGIGKNVSQIVKEINVSMAKHIRVLELVRDKVPEQARASIDRNIERSRERIQIMEAKRAQIKEETGEKPVACEEDSDCPIPLVRCEPGKIAVSPKCVEGKCTKFRCESEEKQKGINAVSDVEIGGAVVYKIFESYEELNAPYENQGRNNTE